MNVEAKAREKQRRERQEEKRRRKELRRELKRAPATAADNTPAPMRVVPR